MGLEKLQRLAEDENLLRLINFPVVMTQVSQVQPTRIWPDDSARQLTRIGTISPDGRRFIVTPEVHSGRVRCLMLLADTLPGINRRTV